MNISAEVGDERGADVRFNTGRPIVDLAGGRTIAVPLAGLPPTARCNPGPAR